MGYEIDFLPVGNASRSGDAIALRYGNLNGGRSEQIVIVIDGGYTDDGEALVSHVKTYYATDHVDFVVSTHPDQDHANGLEVVLEELSVGTLLMHQPWRHSLQLSSARKAAFSNSGLSEELEKSLQTASDLEEIATRRGVNIVEPFQGVGKQDGTFRILGPSMAYYEQLLASMQGAAASPSTTLSAQLVEALKRAARALVPETLNIETLRDDGVTTDTNNTSAICLFTVDGRQLLFTGDAGIPALERAAAVLESEGFKPGQLCFCQIPHHGSRRNVGPAVLNRLLGEKGQVTTHSTAFVSTPPDNPDHVHPAKKVTNAFIRRGYEVHATQGTVRWHHQSAPARNGYTDSTPVSFYDQVEEDSEA
jgi:beta-lactamase superfamily II metal-dependent hydrolase